MDDMKYKLRVNNYEDGGKYLVEPFDGSKFIDYSLDHGLHFFNINQCENIKFNNSDLIYFTNRN